MAHLLSYHSREDSVLLSYLKSGHVQKLLALHGSQCRGHGGNITVKDIKNKGGTKMLVCDLRIFVCGHYCRNDVIYCHRVINGINYLGL